MLDMNQPCKAGSWPLAAIALIVLLPLFYVLSIGPAIWLHHRDLIPELPLTAIYWPLEWLADAMPTISAPLVWYVDVWDGPDVRVVAPVNVPACLPAPPAALLPYQLPPGMPIDYSP
jgi:hypothetical protein